MDLELCRICLSKSATISLFGSEGEVPHSARVMRCVNVVVAEGDGLPDSICEPCAADLLACYHFVNRCEASDKALRAADGPYTHVKTEMLEVKKEKDQEIEFNDYSVDEMLADHLSDSINQCDVEPKRKYSKRKCRSKMPRPKCKICGHKALCKSALTGHMRTHTGEKPFTCDVCGACFNLKGSLRRHILQHSTQRERKFVCDTCGNGFYNKADIKAHMRLHTGERPFHCPYCEKAFTQLGTLISHKLSHTKERPYSCTICPKTFRINADKRRHEKFVHTDEKKFSCHLCNKSVKTKDILRMHLTTHSNNEKHVCSFCGMMLSTKGNLNAHVKRVHSEKSGYCTECCKTFTDLKTHMNKHTGERPFVCKLCDQGYDSKRSLARHMSAKHNHPDKYKCSIGGCSKTFPIPSMLEFHLMKQHTNHTPFMCPHCSRGFYRTCDLTKHLRMGHMDMTGTVSK